jgi:hypothetical protein
MASPSYEEVCRVVEASTSLNTIIPLHKQWPLSEFASLGVEEAYLAVSKGRSALKNF